MKPRSAKAKGTRLEKEVQKRLDKYNCTVRRQPGSGIYSDFPNDVYLDIPGIGPFVLECKARRSGLTSIQKWLGAADMLVMKPDRSEPWIVMPLHVFEQFIAAINPDDE